MDDDLADFLDRIMHKTSPSELIIGRIVFLRPFDAKNPVLELAFIDDETYELRRKEFLANMPLDLPMDELWKRIRVERCLVTPDGPVYEPWDTLTKQLYCSIHIQNYDSSSEIRPSQMPTVKAW